MRKYTREKTKDERLQDAVKNIFLLNSCKIRNLDFDRIWAVGYYANSVRHFYYNRRYGDVECLDEGNRTRVIYLMDNPLIKTEEYKSLNQEDNEEFSRLSLFSKISIPLEERAGVKPPRNFREWLRNNFLFQYRLDWENCSYEVSPRIKDDDEIKLWSNSIVIPVYKGDLNYKVIKDNVRDR